MGNKITAISRTPAKVIINVDIALQVLNQEEVTTFQDIMKKLAAYDCQNKIKRSVSK